MAESKTRTVPYGADAPKPAATPSTETAREFAERHVVEMNGESVRNNQNFDAMVKDAQEQIEANRKATEDA